MDRIVRFLNANETVRFYAVQSTQAAVDAANTHGLSPTACAAMGRSISACAIMMADQKAAKNITLQFKGDGPLQGICVVGRPGVLIKAYCGNPQADVPPKWAGKLNVGALVGQGRLSVIKDLNMREPWVGQVEMRSGEIAEDIAQYYFTSEQKPSAVALGVLVGTEGIPVASGGILAQPLPGCPEEDLVQLEILSRDLGDISHKLFDSGDIEQVLQDTYGPMQLKRLDELPLQFCCDCSRERVEGALIAMGRKELGSLMEQEETTEVTCHFCNAAYRFTREDLMRLLQSATGGV